jgi:uncharacterized glyoxalase superfamily protein PhnB
MADKVKRNRSVPVETVLPHIVYRNVAAAIAWLGDVFGFEEHYRYGEPVAGAQMHLGNAWVMVSGTGSWSRSPADTGFCTQMLTIFVDDVDGHYARSKAAGAKIFEELHETIYGERQYGVEDLEGHRWLFSRHARDVNPEEWGARTGSRE